MAYTDRAGKIITEAFGVFKVAIADTVVPGDLIGPSAGDDAWVLADEDEPVIAHAVAITSGVTGDVITAALAVNFRAPDTQASGVWTAGTLAAAGDVGTALYLSATAGKAQIAQGGTTVQKVGYITSIATVSLTPGQYITGTDQTLSGALTVGGVTSLGDTTTLATNKKIQFRDTGLFIHSSADGKLLISSDGVSTDDITLTGTVTIGDAVALGSTLGVTGAVTHTSTTSLVDDTTVTAAKKIQFRDTGLFIYSSADGKLQISADGAGLDDIILTGMVQPSRAVLPANVQKETLTDVKTLDDGDIGVLQLVTVDAKTVTLPATVVGYFYTIMNGGGDGLVEVTVAPNASDKVYGNGFTATDNKAIVNTKATAKKGDYIKLVADGVNGWMLTEVNGIWARA